MNRNDPNSSPFYQQKKLTETELFKLGISLDNFGKVQNLEELNKVYYNNFAGKLDLLFVRARKILKDNNIDIEKYKLRTAEFEDLINDTLCDCFSPLSAQRISSRIASKF